MKRLLIGAALLLTFSQIVMVETMVEMAKRLRHRFYEPDRPIRKSLLALLKMGNRLDDNVLDIPNSSYLHFSDVEVVEGIEKILQEKENKQSAKN